MKSTTQRTAELRLGIQHRLVGAVAESGLTVAAWARAHGLPRKTLSQWLDGTRLPNADGLLRLSQAGLSPEWLLTGLKPVASAPNVSQTRTKSEPNADLREQVASIVDLLGVSLSYSAKLLREEAADA